MLPAAGKLSSERLEPQHLIKHATVCTSTLLILSTIDTSRNSHGYRLVDNKVCARSNLSPQPPVSGLRAGTTRRRRIGSLLSDLQTRSRLRHSNHARIMLSYK